MATISVIIEYAIISPAVLESIICPGLMGWTSWVDIDEDSFEFSVYCRQEDSANVERELARFV